MTTSWVHSFKNNFWIYSATIFAFEDNGLILIYILDSLKTSPMEGTTGNTDNSTVRSLDSKGKYFYENFKKVSL